MSIKNIPSWMDDLFDCIGAELFEIEGKLEGKALPEKRQSQDEKHQLNSDSVEGKLEGKPLPEKRQSQRKGRRRRRSQDEKHQLKSNSMEPDMKIDSSPTGNQRFTFSRTSSQGSAAGCTSSASSAHNTDDEDSDSNKAISYKDRRREAHTVAEQKRRDAIKKGYDELQFIVPTCHQQQESLGAQKMSKATVLQRFGLPTVGQKMSQAAILAQAIDYMQFLGQQKKKQEDELDGLRKEVMALKIMKANYEHIVKTHQNTPVHGQNQVSDEVKFQVFQQIMDVLFHSFNSSISVANFAELSACVFSWLEEYCKPQSLREAVMTILTQLNSQLTASQP